MVLLINTCTALNFNLFKTLYLIARVTPSYEQEGSNSKSLLILGDSTGYGTGASRSRESVAGLIGATYPDLSITNISYNGRTATQLRDYLKNFSGTYDIILLQIGSNDLLQGVRAEAVVLEIESIVTKLQSHAKRIIVMTGVNIGSARRFKSGKAAAYTAASREYDTLMSKSAKERNFDFVSLFVEPERDPFVLKTYIYTSCDALHPTSVGYALWFKTLQPVLEQALKTSAATAS